MTGEAQQLLLWDPWARCAAFGPNTGIRCRLLPDHPGMHVAEKDSETDPSYEAWIP